MEPPEVVEVEPGRYLGPVEVAEAESWGLAQKPHEMAVPGVIMGTNREEREAIEAHLLHRVERVMTMLLVAGMEAEVVLPAQALTLGLLVEPVESLAAVVQAVAGLPLVQVAQVAQVD